MGSKIPTWPIHTVIHDSNHPALVIQTLPICQQISEFKISRFSLIFAWVLCISTLDCISLIPSFSMYSMFSRDSCLPSSLFIPGHITVCVITRYQCPLHSWDSISQEVLFRFENDFLQYTTHKYWHLIHLFCVFVYVAYVCVYIHLCVCIHVCKSMCIGVHTQKP